MENEEQTPAIPTGELAEQEAKGAKMSEAKGTQFNFFCDMSDALRQLGASARVTARAFASFMDAADPLWATMPGEWPDKFVLLNRYLRTGKRPRFLFNE